MYVCVWDREYVQTMGKTELKFFYLYQTIYHIKKNIRMYVDNI